MLVKTVDGAVYDKTLIHSNGVSTLCKPSQLRALVGYSTSDQGIATDQSWQLSSSPTSWLGHMLVFLVMSNHHEAQGWRSIKLIHTLCLQISVEVPSWKSSIYFTACKSATIIQSRCIVIFERDDSEKHEWLKKKDVVCIDNSNKTRHLRDHHSRGSGFNAKGVEYLPFVPATTSV